jgi:hypothetical protein
VDAPARSVVSCSPQGSGGSSCGTRTCLWRVRDTKTLFCGTSKVICENDEIRKKGLGKTIKSYRAEEKKDGRSTIRRLEVSPELLLWPFGNLFCEMSSRGFLDCGSEIIAVSSLLRHLTVIRRYVHHVNKLGVHAKREESKNLLSLPFINSVFLLIPREIEWANGVLPYAAVAGKVGCWIFMREDS